MTIDGQLLTADNYYDLYFRSTATFGFGVWDGTRMQPNGKVITLSRIEFNQNPVIYSDVIEYEGEKIGYLVYSQFTPGQSGEWLTALDNVFDEFKTAGVTEVVLDLRYNPGGYLDISAHMASTLGSAAAMQ